MSEAVTALNGAHFADGIVEVREVQLLGMITLRADLTDKTVQKAALLGRGTTMPQAGEALIDGDSGVAWMSPDEVLILCPYARVTEELDALQKALGKTHALAVNVSDARASFQVKGLHARDVLAKLCPINLSTDAFGSGRFRRTRMAQVPAALWLAEDDALQIICFRSHAQYVFDLLCVAAQPGSEVGLFTA